MLFNKSENGIDELKSITGFMYSYNKFENIRTDIELAQEDLERIIGAEVMELAEDHYNSEDYQQPTEEPEEPVEDPPGPTPPGGGEPIPPGAGEDETPTPSNELLTSLVNHIQLPVAYHAIHSFSQNTDISHEDSGRKVKIDAEREKLPWEWMLEKDEKAILKKAYRTTDRLINFLDKHIEYFPEWAESDARSNIKGQFISSVDDFIYPIDNSRRFLITIRSFIDEAERKHIRPVLGDTLYQEIKTALASEEGYTDTNVLLPLIRVPLSLFAMSIAVDRLALQVLPEGVFQNLISDRLTQNAKHPALTEKKRELAAQLEKNAQTELKFLQQALTKIAAGEDDYDLPDLAQGLNILNQFARV